MKILSKRLKEILSVSTTMKTSETITHLAQAMFTIQGVVEHKIGKDATADVGKYSYDYTKIEAVVDLIKPLCQKHGILIIQGNGDDGYNDTTDLLKDTGEAAASSSVTIATRLIHAETGEWIESAISLPYLIAQEDKRLNPSQEAGKAVTYGRRYSLVAMFCLTPVGEDNDANTDDVNVFPKGFAPPKSRAGSSTPAKTKSKRATSSTKSTARGSIPSSSSPKAKGGYRGKSIDGGSKKTTSTTGSVNKSIGRKIGKPKTVASPEEQAKGLPGDPIGDMAPAPKSPKRPKKTTKKTKSKFPKPGSGGEEGAFNE